MTTFLLIRHGLTDVAGHTLTGRSPGVHLNSEGMRQADLLPTRLRPYPITAIYSSPLERTQETALPLARRTGLEVHSLPTLIELDFGDWTGRTIESLKDDERWRWFNIFRSTVSIPGGESMLEVQQRTVHALEQVRQFHPGETVAIFSHGDVIRAAIVHYLGMSLDHISRIEVSPASLSIVEVADWGPSVKLLNAS